MATASWAINVTLRTGTPSLKSLHLVSKSGLATVAKGTQAAAAVATDAAVTCATADKASNITGSRCPTSSKISSTVVIRRLEVAVCNSRTVDSSRTTSLALCLNNSLMEDRTRLTSAVACTISLVEAVAVIITHVAT